MGTSKHLTNAQLVALLGSKHAKVDKVPDGWKTRQEWANEFQLTYNYAGLKLQLGVKNGLLERKMFKGPDDHHPIPRWRIK